MNAMKITKLTALLMFICFGAAGTVLAKDCVEAAPESHSVLLENDTVRVIDGHLKAGQKAAMHTHPRHVVYSLTACTLRFNFPDGTVKEAELKEGQAFFSEPVEHEVENIGSTDLQTVVVELKK